MKRISKASIIVICFCLLILRVISCAVNPVTGKREFMLISEQEEISLGAETDKQIRSQYGVYQDPLLEEYVHNLGMVLAPHTHRPNLTYHFAVLDTPVVNAFAVPGGYIYVTRGVLAMMNSEAELAVVLGHELGHVNARHSVRRLSTMLLVQAGLAVGSALSETFAKVSGAAGIGIQLLFLKFSRNDERQADQLGVDYSRKGSYHPGKMIDFFSTLQSMGDLSGGHSLLGFLSTHPLTSERIRNTEAMIIPADNQLLVRQSDYFNHINNLVYGEDPRQGYVEGNAFYHPLLQFYFTFPPNWKLQNTPSRVVLATESGDAAVVLQAEKSSEDLKAYADKKIANLEGKELLDEQSLTINGMSSFQSLLNITQEEEKNLRTRMSFIKYSGNIITFTALSTEDDFHKYDPQFKSLVGSFKQLTDRKYIDRKPKRISLVKANGKQSLLDIFRSAGIKEDLWLRFAIMNSMELDQIPTKGQTIKIIR